MNTITQGMIQVYTGDGKGKTTAALGLALRAVGHGFKVCIIQFMKGEDITGELRAAEKLSSWLTIKPMGRTGFIQKGRSSPEDRALARKALDYARDLMLNRSCDILILDEVNVAVSFGLLDVEDLLSFLDRKPTELEVILTGRGADPRIIERADLVTEMKNIKHYFEKGLPDRVGIER